MSLTTSHFTSRLRGEGLLVLWGSVDLAITNDNDLNDWWTNEHLPERLRLPGFERARRYRAIPDENGHHEYLALYEALKVENFASVEYLNALNNPTPRTKQFMPCLAGMARCACRILLSKQSLVEPSHPSDHGCKYLMLMILHTLRPSEEIWESLDSIVNEQLFSKEHFSSIKVTYVHVGDEDEIITKVGSSSRSYDGVQFTRRHESNKGQPLRKLILLSELCIPNIPKTGMMDILHSEWLEVLMKDLEKTGIEVGYRNVFQLIYSLDKSDIDG